MNAFYSKEGKYIFKNRSKHRFNDDGYENWIINYHGKQFMYESDIQTLIVDKQTQTLEKVCIIDFYSIENTNNTNAFSPTNTAGYSARSIISCVVNLAANIAQPIRNYRYLVVLCSKKLANIYKHVAKKTKISFAKDDVVKGVFNILNPNLQFAILYGLQNYLVFDLSSTPEWKQRQEKNNLINELADF